MTLSYQSCVACREGEAVLKEDEIKKFLIELADGWEVLGKEESIEGKLVKTFEFKDFSEAMVFVNKVGGLAEKEGHHPNIYIHDYKKVKIELWTHKIKGLHKNDFILASKIDKLSKLTGN